MSAATVSAWISALEESSLVFKLPGWSRNATAQVTKLPKIYFTDTGLAAWLAKVRTPRAVAEGAMRGGLYENFVLHASAIPLQGDFRNGVAAIRCLTSHFPLRTRRSASLPVESAPGGSRFRATLWWGNVRGATE